MEIVQNNNKLYYLKRRIRKDQFADINIVQKYMKFIHTEHVLQDVEFYMFCNTIDDIEFEEMPL
jgi:hypothetical protein